MNHLSTIEIKHQKWSIIEDVFFQWVEGKVEYLDTKLKLKPTVKILIFLVLLDAQTMISYQEIKNIIKNKKIIQGDIPDNTLRTSVLSLGQTLDKLHHSLELKSERGRFQLVSRQHCSRLESVTGQSQDSVLLLLEPMVIHAEEIACALIEKTHLPFQALYFSEWSARGWEIFSHGESKIRAQYECDAWERLGIKDRLLKSHNELISVVGLAPQEGLAEIELLKKILSENPQKKVHYLAIDSSQRLLRQHMNLLKEMLATDIRQGRVLCAGVVADIFCHFHEALHRVKNELFLRKYITNPNDFLPLSSSLLVTYLGNCLGNYYPDQETEIFSIIHSIFQNRPLEFLVGVSVKRATPDEYKRNWDDFLLQTPKYLLETSQLLISSRQSDSSRLPEFTLPIDGDSYRCPAVFPEAYVVRHRIEGQIYRFYYKLEYELSLASEINKGLRTLPRGTLILLYNIVKYQMKTLVNGIETSGLFKIKYDAQYHQIVDTPNGTREYAVFSAFLES